jgi:ABC-type antimicrobial peptide transport system permease subunit
MPVREYFDRHRKPVLTASALLAVAAVASWAMRGGSDPKQYVGVLALLLAALGLYNAVAYTVATRRREVGIRLAVGGRPADVFALLIRRGTAVTAAGIAVGLTGAAVLARLIASQVYGVSVMDPITYATAAIVVFVTALLATGIPAFRASRADVTKALRCH